MRLNPCFHTLGSLLPKATLLTLVLLGMSACANLGNVADARSSATLRDAQSAGLLPSPTPPLALAPDWWLSFEDQQLSDLIQRALSSNPSLKMVQARLARARASSDLTGSLMAPQMALGADATRQLFTTNGMIPKPLAGAVYTTATAQLTAGYEFDFFGKNQAALEAALGQSRAAQADADAARILLASQVARAYFQLARLTDQLSLADYVLLQRTQALRLVQDRVNAGLDTQIELRQFEAALPESQQQIEALREQQALASHALTALVSKENKALDYTNPTLVAMKNIADIAVIPFDLLGRRADVTAARWRVEAATHDLGHARGQFYPSVNLMAFAGFSSIGLDQLLSSGSTQWGVGPALRLPLFDGGRLRANLRGKAADLDASIESYNATVLDAVRDAADQLSVRQSVQRQLLEQSRALALAQSAYDLATQRHAAGLTNYLAVLNAETAVLIQRRQGIDLAARALDVQVALVRALGGGYQSEWPVATAHQ